MRQQQVLSYDIGAEAVAASNTTVRTPTANATVSLLTTVNASEMTARSLSRAQWQGQSNTTLQSGTGRESTESSAARTHYHYDPFALTQWQLVRRIYAYDYIWSSAGRFHRDVIEVLVVLGMVAAAALFFLLLSLCCGIKYTSQCAQRSHCKD